jgi:hypothetical protein
MSAPRNPHVEILFDNDVDRAAVASLGIDVDDAFVFAFADLDPAVGCKQIKTAVLTKTEADFDRLLPVANAAKMAIPQPIVQHVENPQTVFLEDCCKFSRDVQVIALAGPEDATPSTLKSIERTLQSLVIRDTDGQTIPTQRRMTKLRITPERIQKDCAQI